MKLTPEQAFAGCDKTVWIVERISDDIYQVTNMGRSTYLGWLAQFTSSEHAYAFIDLVDATMTSKEDQP